jgi:glucose dehydrogenase
MQPSHLLFLAALFAAFPATYGAAQRAPAPPPKFSAKELTAPPTSGWITNGGNVYNQRYSPLAQINRANVATLKPAWRTHLNGSGTDSKYSGQAQPIVYDGVIYIPTGANDVFALDTDTGNILWTHEANLDPNITVICCGWMSRGVAIGEGTSSSRSTPRPAKSSGKRKRRRTATASASRARRCISTASSSRASPVATAPCAAA